MSLYNQLFGVNKAFPILLKMCGVEYSEIPRFRDCFVKDGNVVIYTRTGGGNRECYADDGDCSQCYHTLNDALAAKPNYLCDYDDDYDRTYAYFEFRPLDEYAALFTGIQSNDPGVGAKFKALIAELSKEADA